MKRNRATAYLGQVAHLVALGALVMPLVLLGPTSTKAIQAPTRTEARNDLYGDPLPEGAVARLGTLRFRQGAIGSLIFVANGKVLAARGSHGLGLCMWDAQSGKPLHRLTVPSSVAGLTCSADGNTLLTDDLSMIDVATGKVVRQLKAPRDRAYFRVACSPDGRTVAGGEIGVAEPMILLWEFATGQEIQRLI